MIFSTVCDQQHTVYVDKAVLTAQMDNKDIKKWNAKKKIYSEQLSSHYFWHFYIDEAVGQKSSNSESTA